MSFWGKWVKFCGAMLLALMVTSCTVGPVLDERQSVVPNEVASDFPYHPLVYHLDLSILAYQLYGQSLVWPFDPYYEEHAANRSRRSALMLSVHSWAEAKGREQQTQKAGVEAYRGPGSLIGLPNNNNHDPIIYDYGLIHPWSNTLTNAEGTWTEYMTPKSITKRIKSVHVCSHKAGTSPTALSLDRVPIRVGSAGLTLNDMLYAFEGGTGDKGEPGRPASQSLMGFILVREKPLGGYDIHVAFRGSRSGSASRAVIQALSDSGAKGNPDWITDLGYNRLSAGQGSSHVSTVGKVHRGFARSMKSILPNLFHCIDHIGRTKAGNAPANIYVTGHSLGGALAQAFVASVLIGDRYGPNGHGSSVPNSVRSWPWQQIKLISYSAPRIGDERFAETLTKKHLQSEFFSTPLNPVDVNAIKPNSKMVLERLLNASRPAAFRVLHSKDPITTEKGAGGKHVGKTVYVNVPGIQDVFSGPDFNTHEQRVIRDMMLAVLPGQGIPKLAMRYRKMADIVPNRDKTQKGSLQELNNLAAGVSNYYAGQNTWFDKDKFNQNLKLRLQLEQQP